MTRYLIRPVIEKYSSLTRYRQGGLILEAIFTTSAMCLLIFLCLYHQPYYPVSWQDEGFVLQGAMNLARYGKYAMLSSEGFRILDQPLVANGPGVVLPIAAVFSTFGIGLLQARMVIWLFMLWALAMFYILANQLTGRTASWISMIMLLSATDEGFLYYGRVALGNMPALAYMLTGFVVLLVWIRKQKLLYAALAGLFFGLSVITKAQTALVIPALVFAAFFDFIYYRKTRPFGWAMMIAMIGISSILWYLTQYLIVGQDNFTEHLAAIASSSRATIFVLSLERIPRNLWQFLISGMPLYFLPGLLWSIWKLRDKSIDNVARFPLVILAVIWLGWFFIFSIGWHRYFFEPAVVGILFSGKLIIDLGNSIFTTQNTAIRIASLVLVCVFSIAVVFGLGNNIRRIVAQPDTTLQKFAEYLLKNINANAVIESWEWQIDPLANLTFHHPTNDWVDRMTHAITFGKIPQESYKYWEYQPEFLIIGPFGKDTGLYTESIENGCCNLIYSMDPYFLFQVNYSEEK